MQLRPNQSLKLTEPAVDDFAARNNHSQSDRTCLARTGFRRCGTSSPQLSSGPLGPRKEFMDKRIRLNEICVIGLPRCDFAFSSTRTCFIAFGFEESPLEMTILRKLLQEKGIQPVEASGILAPAQNAFCAKICSKIITSQFCIVLLNNDESGDKEIPNANVNMEYGLMLGFNKYVIPFQRESQKYPSTSRGWTP